MKNYPDLIADNIITDNRYMNHLIFHQKKYLVSLASLILLVPLISRFIINRPLFVGSESYFFLEKLSILNLSSGGLQLLIILPFLMGILTVLMILRLGKSLNLPENLTFFFTFFLIFSPAFIFSYGTLSFYSFTFTLMLIGFLLLTSSRNLIRYLSFIPFLIISLIDNFSSILLLVLLTIYCLSVNLKISKKEYFDQSAVIILSGNFLAALIGRFMLGVPFFIGPFHSGRIVIDLISDLGALSGLSIFIFILALMGLKADLKNKQFYFAYLLLPMIIPYFFNAEVIFPLSVLIIFFSAIGFVKLFEKNWALPSLKSFTFLLLILGIVFSSLAYAERFQNFPPSIADRESLTWIKENTLGNTIISTSPEYGYYVKYFSGRDVFYLPDRDDKNIFQLNQGIYSSLYINELFPILEQNNVSVIYISKDMKNNLPKEQGLLFLVKNERFKLIHSSEESEVWVFKKEAENK